MFSLDFLSVYLVYYAVNAQDIYVYLRMYFIFDNFFQLIAFFFSKFFTSRAS